MPNDVELRELRFGTRYTQKKPDLFIGQCNEFPFIIVKGKSVEDLTSQIKKHIILYINTFPEKANSVVLKYNNQMAEDNIKIDKKVPDDKWLYHEQLLTIPT